MIAQTGKEPAQVIVRGGVENFQQQIIAGKHKSIADEPLSTGGDAGPNPYDYLLAALGACTDDPAVS